MAMMIFRGMMYAPNTHRLLVDGVPYQEFDSADKAEHMSQLLYDHNIGITYRIEKIEEN